MATAPPSNTTGSSYVSLHDAGRNSDQLMLQEIDRKATKCAIRTCFILGAVIASTIYGVLLGRRIWYKESLNTGDHAILAVPFLVIVGLIIERCCCSRTLAPNRQLN